jgi:septal ring factor EnvC (AmiA/AmiB activator)
MTEKQEIIINGVDVSKCDKLIVNQLYGYACNCEEDTHIISSCKNRHNCYYKQLARKTQECEQKEKELLSNEKIINKLMKEVDELKQECEKLKNQVDEDYNYYTTELKTLRDIISNKEKRNAALFLTSGRYRKALDEIERICLENVRIFADGTELRYDSLDDILDIINKLKGGNDE